MAQETIDLVHAFYKGDEYSRQLPGKKDYLKHTEKCLQTKAVSSVWCNLHELFVAFKEINPDVKTEFSKFCTLRRKWSFRAEMCNVSLQVIRNTLGMHLYYSSKHHCVVDALNWEVTYKYLINKVVCDPLNCECMMHGCTAQEQTHYINFCKRSSVTPVLIFNFTTHNVTIHTELPW